MPAKYEKTPWQEILGQAKQTLEYSSVHGLTNLIKNRFYYIKAMWAMFLLASAITCGCSIQRLVANYFNRDVTSKTEVSYQTKLIFPVVNICNLNPFTSQFSKQFIHSKMMTNATNIDSIYSSRSLANILSRENQTMLGVTDVKETILSCSFNGIECNLSQDFELFYDVNYGNCFRFNSGKSSPFKYALYTGIYGSLDVEVYVGLASLNEALYSKENGLNVFINNETMDSTYQEGIQLSPGFSTRVI